MKTPALLALAAALLPAASRDPLEGYVPAGPAQRCVTDFYGSPTILDGHTVGIRQSGRRWWISRIDGCPSLEPLSTLIIEKYGSQLCDVDRFRVLTPGVSIPSAYCRFGKWVPHDRVKTR